MSVYVKNDLPHYEIELNTTLQAVACSVKMGQSRICLCSIYSPPNENLVYQELSDVILQLPKPFIICTDANSRH